MTRTDWTTTIEDGIGDGPDPRPPGAAVAAGRRTLRRRRLLQATLGGAVLAAGLGLGLLPDRDSPPIVATEPRAEHQPTPASTDLPLNPRDGRLGLGVEYTKQGELVRDDAEVRIDGVYTDVYPTEGATYWDGDAGPWVKTAAVASTTDGVPWWTLLRWSPENRDSRGRRPIPGMTFDEWVSRVDDDPMLMLRDEAP